MQERIQHILESKNLSPSNFADEVNLSRAVVSHILHGRNKLSLDNIEKILIRYPEINPLWLITGKGDMYLENVEDDQNPTLFDERAIFAGTDAENSEYSKENSSKNSLYSIKQPDIQVVKAQIQSSPRVKKIAIFYSDNTYEEFVPATKG